MKSLLPAYIESLRPIIYIEDTDFHAIDDCIESVAGGAKIYEYSSAYGAMEFKKCRSVSSSNDTSLFDFLNIYKDSGFDSKVFLILKDIHHGLKGPDSPKIIAQLRHIAEKTLYAEAFHTVVFIISGTREIPKELEHLITLFPGTRPEQIEIETLLKNFASSYGFTIDNDDIGPLALELKGLSYFQIQQILNLAYCKGGNISFEEDKKLIFEEKKQIVEKSGMLEFMHFDESLSDVGGLAALKEWLERKALIFNELDRALKAGVDRPNGVLILGVPGCGKSLIAKTTAHLFGVPLVRLDIGRVLGKYVGESEHNMRAALKLAEAISPCILWIDEIEKAFAGAGSGSGHEVTIRLIGQFLTWMQEKHSTVFVVATANDISSLPPEFLRKGRFDEIFSVDLPNEEERLDILKIHLARRKQPFRKLDLYSLLSKTSEFSGADIEYAVATAVESAFVNDREYVTDEELLEAVKDTRPLAKSLKEKIQKQREVLKEYDVRPAASKDVPKRPKKRTGKKDASLNSAFSGTISGLGMVASSSLFGSMYPSSHEDKNNNEEKRLLTLSVAGRSPDTAE